MQTFEERITDKNKISLAPKFISFVFETAKANNKTADEIWRMWQEYSSHGMSAIKSEFIQWYNLKAVA